LAATTAAVRGAAVGRAQEDAAAATAQNAIQSESDAREFMEIMIGR
jgi:hypothetical protein